MLKNILNSIIRYQKITSPTIHEFIRHSASAQQLLFDINYMQHFGRYTNSIFRLFLMFFKNKIRFSKNGSKKTRLMISDLMFYFRCSFECAIFIIFFYMMFDMTEIYFKCSKLTKYTKYKYKLPDWIDLDSCHCDDTIPGTWKMLTL